MTDLNIDNNQIDETAIQNLKCVFTNKEITSSILKLKSEKSQGKVDIVAKFDKNTCSQLTPILCKMFNRILTTGEFPVVCSQSIFVPLHQFGDKNDPSCYRGILLTDVIYKIFSNGKVK